MRILSVLLVLAVLDATLLAERLSPAKVEPMPTDGASPARLVAVLPGPGSAEQGKALTYQGKTVREWIRLASSSDDPMQQQALTALDKIGPAFIPILTELLKDEEANVRLHAAQALRNLGPEAKPAIPALIGSLKDEHGMVRAQAAWTLGKIGPEAKPAIPVLTELLKDEGPLVRLGAAEALVEIDSQTKAAIPVLTEFLKDENVWNRLHAAKALAKIDSEKKNAVAALTELLKNKDARQAASEALKAIQGGKR